MVQRPPYLSLALLSASALAYEILLMRLFSIIQWHHFAYMIIGLALLGYGISGTIVSITQSLLLKRYKLVYIACISLFSLSSVMCFHAAQTIPFNAEMILWDSRQALYLICIFLLLTIPFIFAASGICLTFMFYRGKINTIYAMDLVGAGIGSLGIILLLYLFLPLSTLIAISIFGLLSALIAIQELKIQHPLWLSLATFIIIGMLLVSGRNAELNVSPYKGLQQALRINGTKVITERSSPLGLLSVIESQKTPLRHTPGLSLMATHEPLPQLGIFTDNGDMTVITKFPEKREQLKYLDQITTALPYHLKKTEQVLIVGTGGGSDVLQAIFHEVPDITAVEINPQIINLVNKEFNHYSGGLYQRDNVSVHIGEARDYLTKTNQQYDLIQLSLLDAFNASSSGLYSLNESYLYTTETLQLYLDHIKSNGFLSISRWIKIPPRDTLKLFSTAIKALNNTNSQFPEYQLALIRSWQTSTLLVKKGHFSQDEIKAIKVFCDNRLFDIAYLPDITESLANRYNVLRTPLFYHGAISLLGSQHNEYMSQYKFNLTPATNDKPYFHHFFKWSTLPEIFQLREKGGMPLIEWGYMILVITLIAAVTMSIILIILPLIFFRKNTSSESNNIKRAYVLCYFFIIGLAFLFIEIAFIQKFILFLHHPIYSVSVTLTAFMVFAGLGSNISTVIAKKRLDRQIVTFAVFGISSLCLLYIFILGPIFSYLLAMPVSVKIPVTIILIAPLAFFMGMPFPLALSSLTRHASNLVPWAWGINGCASVISAVLASLLAIHFGFTVVILIAILLYIAIIFLFPAGVNLVKTK